MLKNSLRSSILSKYNVTYCCIKKYYQKMQNQGINSNNINQDSSFVKASYQQDDENDMKKDVFKNIRKWITIDQTNRPGFIFTIFNYNILSQALLESHEYLYKASPRQALKWNNRLYNIVGEVFKTNPSILCFQEVQWNHLAQIQNRLNCMNYGVLFKKRTGDKPDGCAIFYKNDLFDLIEEHNVEFNQPGIELLNRENVAIIAKLCLKGDHSTQFLVATTHLLYNPRREDIRLAQVQVLLAELDRHAKNIDGAYMPVILTGDFNLKPYSAPYCLLTNGVLNYANLSSRTLMQFNKGNPSSQTNGRRLLPIKLGISDACQHVDSDIKLYHSEQNQITHYEYEDIKLTTDTVNIFETGTLRHSFKFKSVYHNNDEAVDQNYVSTFQNEWILVDYIFYSSQNSVSNITNLQLLNYLSLPTREELEKLKIPLPNPFLGSDHLSLAAQFKLFYNENRSIGNMTKL